MSFFTKICGIHMYETPNNSVLWFFVFHIEGMVHCLEIPFGMGMVVLLGNLQQID